MIYLITVKLPKNPNHNPHNKITGMCPVSTDAILCTDVTGEHHTLLHQSSDSLDTIIEHAKLLYGHVTRVECVR